MIRDECATNWRANETCNSDDAVKSSNTRSQFIVGCDSADYRGRKSSYITSAETVYAYEEDERRHGVAEQPKEET
jgi:hypothetical protein